MEDLWGNDPIETLIKLFNYEKKYFRLHCDKAGPLEKYKDSFQDASNLASRTERASQFINISLFRTSKFVVLAIIC